ncbi:uncharacterized protein LOC125188190 [Salvia hispanica]|uniref:uncharacterized protein LOC125188190 n=1 Tax=Salvia hispanica TaxID=49212 RepID=UPI0020097D51|nr:uncharacterized protein LOC125188190 [Salvia hispanica]
MINSKVVLLPIAVGILMLAAIKQASSMVMPQIHVQQLHIREDSIKIGLEFSRHRVPSPVRYNDVNITLYHASSDQVAGQSVIPGFNMGWDEKTVHREAVVAARGLPWEDALRKIGDGSTVDLRVALTTKYRTDDYDDCCCCTVKKAMAVAADFRVDGFGKALVINLSCNSIRFGRFKVFL